jgi:hypothetical protein
MRLAPAFGRPLRLTMGFSVVFGALMVELGGANAAAQTFAEKLVICDKAADVALSATEARDLGTPLVDVQKSVAGVGADANHIALLTVIVTLTYTMEGVEGVLMQEVTRQMCQKSMGLK